MIPPRWARGCGHTGWKAWQVREAAQTIRPLIGPETCVVTLQNGVEAPGHVAEVLGVQHVLGGLCGLIAFIVAPGHIRHAGAEPFVRFGELDNRASLRAERLRQAFVRASVQVDIPSDIHVALWMKLLFITPWSGIGAVTVRRLGWRSLPETRAMVTQCLQEIAAVARAQAIALPEDAMEQTWALYETLPPGGTASATRYAGGASLGTGGPNRSGGASGTPRGSTDSHSHVSL